MTYPVVETIPIDLQIAATGADAAVALITDPHIRRWDVGVYDGGSGGGSVRGGVGGDSEGGDGCEGADEQGGEGGEMHGCWVFVIGVVGDCGYDCDCFF